MQYVRTIYFLKDSSLAAALLCWFTLSEITTICKLIQDKVIVIIIMKMRISGRKIEYTNKMDDNSKKFHHSKFVKKQKRKLNNFFSTRPVQNVHQT